ncbi:MAG: hypothetical protein ACLTCQ_24490 [Enterocloster bolteae]
MIYIEVKKDKWKELEHYHAEYIEETLPGRWKSFCKKEVPMTEIDVVCQILENHDMIKKKVRSSRLPILSGGVPLKISILWRMRHWKICLMGSRLK